MPTTFDTPMFWPETDLEELKGTTIAEKLDAMRRTRSTTSVYFLSFSLGQTYSNPSISTPTTPSLSEGNSDDEQEQHEDNHGQPISEPRAEDADVSMESVRSEQAPEDEGGDSDSDDDEEKVEDVSMVPMADMLNARYGGENAKLFYEPAVLKMVTTKPVSAGEQIWNTYGDPPNSDLLRRYGYIDALGTGLDIVELKGSLVVECVSLAEDERKARVDWWLEMGGDDTFTLEMTSLLPSSLLSFVQLLLLSSSEWERAQEKDKAPKPKSEQIYTTLQEALTKRLRMYPTTLQDDETELSSNLTSLSTNKRHALTIRIGEKRVLHAALGRISEVSGAGSKKRKAEGEGGARKKGKGTKQK
ncbi:RuBisCO LSMT substrate-binding protein [Ceratobasidium sp. AG-Ba]|nr:RuBisCO LSMT substrate-binding protein [Ceratobasidium sp. AG-Ba]